MWREHETSERWTFVNVLRASDVSPFGASEHNATIRLELRLVLAYDSLAAPNDSLVNRFVTNQFHLFRQLRL